MNIADIFSAVKTLAEDDQSIPDAKITTWVDFAIDRINAAVQCKIPGIKGQPTSYVPEFDSRFHESLVLFSVSKYRESDSSYNDAQYFLNQFNDMLLTMQRDMEISPSTRVDYNTQQIVVTDASVFTYPLTMQSGSYFDDVLVYKNNVKLANWKLDNTKQQLTLVGTTLTIGDKITVVFENNSDLNAPPYQWWNGSGW